MSFTDAETNVTSRGSELVRTADFDFHQRLCVHGMAVEISSAIPVLRACLDHFLYPMSVEHFPDGMTPLTGFIRPYEESEVLKCLSAGAKRVRCRDPFLEIYQDGERYWLVDENWGMTEVNCLRRQFRSWVLPHPAIDIVQCFDAAVMWPLAQLLRPRGLHLVPGVSMTRDGWSVLLLTQLSIEGEISRLLRSGYKVIGQRWTALRDEEGRIELLHLPGAVSRPKLTRATSQEPGADIQWVDLTLEHSGTMQNFAFCDAVLIVDSRRSMIAQRRELSSQQAVERLRQDWPINDLQPARKWADLPMRISQLCRCVQVGLSYDPADLSLMLSAIRVTPPARVQVSLFSRDSHGRPMAPASTAA